MPSGQKNTKFTNRHAEEAKAREEAIASEKKAMKKQKAEDASWDDDDKQTARKAARAAELANKDADAARRKAERLEELEAEEKELSKKPPKAVSRKEEQRRMAALVRNYDMEQRLNAQSSDSADLATRHDKAIAKPAKQAPLVEGNPNRDAPEATAGPDSTIEGVLKKSRVEDRGIGKKARAAYRQFEAANFDIIKKSKPGLRRTQYNDLLWTMWQKSPENPFVQRAVQRADDAIQRKWCQADEEPSSDSDDE